MTSWYAVHTQPHAESRAFDNLLRQGYRAYLPRCRIWVSHARRRQLVFRPLFPRYLFAAVDEPAMRWRPILSTFGVSDLVRAGDRPAPVPSEIVEAIRAREQDGAFNGLDPRRTLQPGELVRVTAGAFADAVGQLVELYDNDRVVVLLDLLGRAVRARLAGNMVEAA
ncbi:MAG: transcriptional activator RfaH [Stellaceae bacterium]|jgi:transcriptional antiterminator RfaH